MAPRKPRPTNPAAVATARLKLAQRLHDTVCQELTGISFLAAAAAEQHRAEDPRVVQKFQEISDLIQNAGAHLAEIVHQMRASE